LHIVQKHNVHSTAVEACADGANLNGSIMGIRYMTTVTGIA